MLLPSPYRAFSRELFWDTAPEKIDFVKHQRWVVARVLEHGRLEDWKALKRLYPMPEIVASAKRARSLDEKALAFISFVSGEPRETFRCFTSRRLPQRR